MMIEYNKKKGVAFMDINKYVKSMQAYSRRVEKMNSSEKRIEATKSLKAAGLLNNNGTVKREIIK